MTIAAVELDVLLRVVGASLAAGLILTLAYCLFLYGGTAYVDERRRGHPAAALAYGALAVLGGAVFVGALVLGLVIMTSKG